MLDSLFKHTPGLSPQDVVIIDDGSSERELQVLRRMASEYHVVFGEHRRNLGIPAGWNHATDALKTDVVVLLNDDVLLAKGWLDAISYFVENNPKAGLVGLHAYDETGKVFCTSDGAKQYDVNFAVPHRGLCANGFCFGFRKELWSNNGGFDEMYTSFYEECDLGLQFSRQGYFGYNLPWPVIQHEWGVTFRENESQLLPKIRMEQSRERFVNKWGGDIAAMYARHVTPVEPEPLVWLQDGKSVSGFSIDMVR